jgi:hypothetical protein
VHFIPHRASLYSDDLFLFVRPHAEDLQVMWHIFSIFEGASGLGCNQAKCQLAPILCVLADIKVATTFLSCQVTDFPFKYLGVSLLTSTKIPKHALQPFVDKVVDHLLFWKGQLMNRSSRLALIKSTLSAMTTHLTISLGLPPWVLKALEKNHERFSFVKHRLGARREMLGGMGLCSKAIGAGGGSGF